MRLSAQRPAAAGPVPGLARRPGLTAPNVTARTRAAGGRGALRRGITVGLATAWVSVGLGACGSPQGTATAPAARPAGTASVVSAPVHIAHTRLGAIGYRAVGSAPSLVLIMGYAGTMEDWDPRLVDAQALAVLRPSQVRRLVLCATFPGNRPGRGALASGDPGAHQWHPATSGGRPVPRQPGQSV